MLPDNTALPVSISKVTFAKITNSIMSTQHLSEQEIIRREKLAELKKLGIDAYPAALYPVNTTSIFIKENYKGEENKNDFADVCLAGRLMGIRDMGKASFFQTISYSDLSSLVATSSFLI